MPPPTISVRGVEDLLSEIEATKASEPDGIPSCISKEELAPSIVLYLAAVYNQTLTTGHLPKEWLEVNISPVYKKGSRHEA